MIVSIEIFIRRIHFFWFFRLKEINSFLILSSLVYKEVKEEQLKNIPLISLTLIVLKLDKFKEVKEEQ